jgi:hypothetical protein
MGEAPVRIERFDNLYVQCPDHGLTLAAGVTARVQDDTIIELLVADGCRCGRSPTLGKHALPVLRGRGILPGVYATPADASVGRDARDVANTLRDAMTIVSGAAGRGDDRSWPLTDAGAVTAAVFGELMRDVDE